MWSLEYRPKDVLEKMEEIFDPNAVIEEFEDLSINAGKVQREALKKILEENGEAEYLRRWGLDGRTDPESFIACVPLVTHKDLEPYIQRIADGETASILTAKSITTISLSSGTTQGKPKFVPFNDELMESTMQIYKTSFAFRNREYPIGNGKALQFIYSSKQFKTKGGLAAGTATTNVYRNPQFKNTMRAMQTPCCSPDEVIFGPDFHQSLYCHLLCGLIFREEVQVVSSTFAHSIVHAFRTFEQVWEELVTDIREGSLSNRITVPSIRLAVSKLLNPDPLLANTIFDKISGLNEWNGLIQELFPNTKYIYGIMTGSMEPYLKKLRHYAGQLPLLSADYGSSEGWVGVNVNPRLPPELATFAVLPNAGYFEFIPVKDDTNCPEQERSCISSVEPQPLGLTEVKVGEDYEIIVTNFAAMSFKQEDEHVNGRRRGVRRGHSFLSQQDSVRHVYRDKISPALALECGAIIEASRVESHYPGIRPKLGLYRYRLGDLVKVKGFHNSTPELQFVCRRNLLLTINIDKNTEKDLQLAVEAAVKLLTEEKLEVLDFTSQVDTSTDPGHYVIFWEISGEVKDEILKECCNCLDRSFLDAGYVSSRKVNTIGALELRIVKGGTFHKVLDHFVGLGAAVSQFKTPRCVGKNNGALLQILSINVVKNYFSTAY